MNQKYNNFRYVNREMVDLILGRKGGKTTIRVIDQILYQPNNVHQLSKILKLDYKTVQYHVELIKQSELIETDEKKYGTLYYPTKKLIKNLKDYEQIKKYLKKF